MIKEPEGGGASAGVRPEKLPRGGSMTGVRQIYATGIGTAPGEARRRDEVDGVALSVGALFSSLAPSPETKAAAVVLG